MLHHTEPQYNDQGEEMNRNDTITQRTNFIQILSHAPLMSYSESSKLMGGSLFF